MTFLLRAFKSENYFWKYIVGSILIIIASTLGQLPLMGFVMAKLISEGKGFYHINETDLMTVLDKNFTLFLLLFSFLVALYAIYLVLKFLHKQSLLDIITCRKKIDWKRIFFAFSIWGIFQIITTIISYYTAPEDFVLNFKPLQFAILAVIAIVMIPIQTSVEELIFRGYLMQGFGLLAKNRWFPLLMTSLIFGLLHLGNPEVAKMGYITMVYYISTGLFLGILVLMDDGLELSLGFHAANNLFTALLVTSDWTAFQTYSILKEVSKPEVGLEIVFPVFIVFPILLFVFAKKYNWTNWKEKLTGKLAVIPEQINVKND
ncbi:abortive phage infection protein [Flavobacterium psychrophilum]|uniref:CPBP family intramembrane glutamic endopeptidase n=1 Tax=Flavobacterium psychrophilum TaxID=96345 RepID=UPI00074341F2|nr:CPBP family intramembrane glutamic endopeptidase [Flavobacterium psychrophilum]EKT4518731.1 CPBP family intramembrane metalloprotease [Flavobacterium psychrophilum]KUM16310.1 abortive phage infection protein [Flavobacterium psychrophilum]